MCKLQTGGALYVMYDTAVFERENLSLSRSTKLAEVWRELYQVWLLGASCESMVPGYPLSHNS